MIDMPKQGSDQTLIVSTSRVTVPFLFEFGACSHFNQSPIAPFDEDDPYEKSL